MIWPILEVRQVSVISPSRFSGMQGCQLREAWAAGGAQGLVPSSPSAFIGTVVHKVVEEASLGTDENPAQLFDRLARAADDRLLEDPIHCRWVPLSEHAPDYSQIRQRAIDLALAATPNSRRPISHGRRRVGREVRVTAREGKLRGIIDEVDVSGGRVILRDLKTGVVRRSGTTSPEAKQEYATQMRMYAAMYAEDDEISGGKWPHLLELVPLFGPSLSVPFNPDECILLLDQAVEALAAINRTIEAHDRGKAEMLLARPSPDVCRWCAYRPVCIAYRNASSRDDDVAWPADVWGSVADKAVKGNGTLAISVRRGEQLFRIRDIEPTSSTYPQFAGLDLGSSIGVFGLRRSRVEDTFSASDSTVIYLLD